MSQGCLIHVYTKDFCNSAFCIFDTHFTCFFFSVGGKKIWVGGFNQGRSGYRKHTYFFSPPPVKPEGTIGLHSVCPSVCLSVCPSVCLSVTHVFWTFLHYAFTYLNESW